MASDNFDLYGDLDDALIEPLQEEVDKNIAETLAKSEENKKFREETDKIIKELEKSNFQLKKNLSLLLATAKAEIERKDQQIKDLRREMDQIIFRKTKVSRSTNERSTQTDRIELTNKISNFGYIREDNKYIKKSRTDKIKNNESNYKRKRESPDKKRYSNYDHKKSSNSRENSDSYRSRSKSRNREIDMKSSHRKKHYVEKSPDRQNKNETDKKKHRDIMKNEDLRPAISKKECNDDKKEKNNDKKNETSYKKSNSSKLIKKVEDGIKINSSSNPEPVKNQLEKNRSEKNRKDVEKTCKPTFEPFDEQLPVITEKAIRDITLNNDMIIEHPVEHLDAENDKNLIDEEKEPIKITNADSQQYVIEDIEMYGESEMIKQLKNLQDVNQINSTKIDEVKIENNNLNIGVALNTEANNETEISISERTKSYLIEDEVSFTLINNNTNNQNLNDKGIKDLETSADVLTNEPSANNLFNSTKESSFDNSMENEKHKKKRKIITTEVEDDGTVVFTVVRKKKKRNTDG